MKDIHDQTYYELLEIDSSATQEEILKAYNRARATYGHNSPALYSLFNKEEAQELLKLIDEAYAVLSNQFKRKQYDTGAAPRVSEPAKEVFPPEKERRKPSAPPPAEDNFAIPSAGTLPEFGGPPLNGMPEVSMNTMTEPAQPNPPIMKDRRAPKSSGPPTAPVAKTETAQGMGSTPFGNYVLDPVFEDEIKKSEEFSGTFIQRVRLYKNISLDQICETTKISRSYLIAVEANNFTSLPAPVFVRGFIVQIAKILGLDPSRTSASFIKLLKEAQIK